MRFIGNVIEKLQRHPKRVVFPEGEEPRILQAARQFFALRLGAPIVLGDQAKIKEVAEAMKIPLDGIRVINPATSDDLENFSKRFHSLRREKGLRATEAREAMLQPNYFGTMMLAMHQADGLISGASHNTGSVLRPLFQIIKVAPDIATASSCMVMEVEDTRIGENGASPCSRFQPKAARRIRASEKCRRRPHRRSTRQRNYFWKRISTANCKWTPRSCRKLPKENCTTAKSPGARTF
jgi:hypothetical protein